MSTNHRWEAVNTLIAVSGVAIAGLALWQSHTTANRQNEIAERAVGIQEKQYESGQAGFFIGDVAITLSNAGSADVVSYPTATGDELERIPIETWNSHNTRFLNFSLNNYGASPVYLNLIGIGRNETKVSWTPMGYRFCKNKDTNEWMNSCTREILPRTEEDYSIPLDDVTLSGVEEGWASQGIEVCVDLEIYGVYCEQSTKTTLPAGVLG